MHVCCDERYPFLQSKMATILNPVTDGSIVDQVKVCKLLAVEDQHLPSRWLHLRILFVMFAPN